MNNIAFADPMGLSNLLKQIVNPEFNFVYVALIIQQSNTIDAFKNLQSPSFMNLIESQGFTN